MVDQSTLRFLEAVSGTTAAGVADSEAFLGVALGLRGGMAVLRRSEGNVWCYCKVSATMRLASRVW
jgi:hypothetical protein